MQAAKGRGRAGKTHLEILKKRYAKGEVTKEEFDRMKKDISE
jgi:putative membrane protein